MYYRKIPILGKHTKRITCGAWSKGGLLALGSEDRSVSVSNGDGDTIRQSSLRDTPSDVHFSEMKMDERSKIGEDTVSPFCTLLFKRIHIVTFVTWDQMS